MLPTDVVVFKAWQKFSAIAALQMTWLALCVAPIPIPSRHNGICWAAAGGVTDPAGAGELSTNKEDAHKLKNLLHLHHRKH